MSTPTLLTHKKDIQTAHWQRLPSYPLVEGQVRLRIESFAFTSNNVTYAAFGDLMNYWQFYPVAVEGYGVIPVWGFARITESRCEGLIPGELFYGYYPFATEVVLSPARVSPAGFVEGSPHRASLAAVYNQYNRCEVDPLYHPGQEHIQSLLRPLYITSWLIDDFFSSNADFGATHLLLSSASSKTAYGTAFAMSQRYVGKTVVVGLTSPKNREFCESLGCYHRVLTYDELHEIDAGTACAYVDFSGSVPLRRAVHERFSKLNYSCAIGATHVSELGGNKGLPGPKPELFFAPAQIKKRVGDWGGAEFTRRVAESFSWFCTRVSNLRSPWMEIQRHEGPEAALHAYQLVVSGDSDPRAGHIIIL